MIYYDVLHASYTRIKCPYYTLLFNSQAEGVFVVNVNASDDRQIIT